MLTGDSSSLHSSRPRKRRRQEDPQERGKHVYPHVLEPAVAIERLHRGPLESNESMNSFLLFLPRMNFFLLDI